MSENIKEKICKHNYCCHAGRKKWQQTILWIKSSIVPMSPLNKSGEGGILRIDGDFLTEEGPLTGTVDFWISKQNIIIKLSMKHIISRSMKQLKASL